MKRWERGTIPKRMAGNRACGWDVQFVRKHARLGGAICPGHVLGRADEARGRGKGAILLGKGLQYPTRLRTDMDLKIERQGWSTNKRACTCLQ